MGMRWGLCVVAVVVSLAGCGSGSESTSSRPSTSTTSATPTSAPTPTLATPEEVAVVIAGNQDDWREVIDGAGECRIRWVMAQDDPVESAQRLACYTREVTAGLTAQTALRDLEHLNAPPSMTTLVETTTEALQQMADVDLEAVCGPAPSEPNGTKLCNEAMGQRMWGYNRLEKALDMWTPYL